MPDCAVVQLTDNVVVNKIVAEPTDPAPDGTYLISIDGIVCDMGWIWDGTNFINPNPPSPVEPLPDDTIEGVSSGN